MKLSTSVRSRLFMIWLRKNNVKVERNLSIGRFFKFKINKNSKVQIGANVIINDDVYINVKKGATLIIGDNVHINKGVRISSFDSIIIGSNTLIASYCNILDHNHKFDLISPASITEYDCAPIKIGTGVWLGAKVQVNKGVEIGEFTIVASNSVVTKKIESNSIYGGIPATKIK